MIYIFDLDNTLLDSRTNALVYAKVIENLVSKGYDPLMINEEVKIIKAETLGEGRACASALCGRLECPSLYLFVLGSVVGERDSVTKLFDTFREMRREVGIVSSLDRRTLGFLLQRYGIKPGWVFCGGDKTSVQFWHSLKENHGLEPKSCRVVSDEALEAPRQLGFRTLRVEAPIDYRHLKLM